MSGCRGCKSAFDRGAVKRQIIIEDAKRQAKEKQKPIAIYKTGPSLWKTIDFCDAIANAIRYDSIVSQYGS